MKDLAASRRPIPQFKFAAPEPDAPTQAVFVEDQPTQAVPVVRRTDADAWQAINPHASSAAVKVGANMQLSQKALARRRWERWTRDRRTSLLFGALAVLLLGAALLGIGWVNQRMVPAIAWSWAPFVQAQRMWLAAGAVLAVAGGVFAFGASRLWSWRAQRTNRPGHAAMASGAAIAILLVAVVATLVVGLGRIPYSNMDTISTAQALHLIKKPGVTATSVWDTGWRGHPNYLYLAVPAKGGYIVEQAPLPSANTATNALASFAAAHPAPAPATLADVASSRQVNFWQRANARLGLVTAIVVMLAGICVAVLWGVGGPDLPEEMHTSWV